MKTFHFRLLSKEQEYDFRYAARKSYDLFTEIKGIWHPAYQLECVTMNIEAATFVPDKE